MNYSVDRNTISSKHSLHSYVKTNKTFIPIIYNNKYDIYFWKLENIHWFDTKKWGKIATFLKDFLKTLSECDSDSDPYISPTHPITNEELSLVHSQSFIRCINWSPLAVATASEVCPLLLVPICITQCKLLTPLKWQVSGSILGGFLALKYGWAINLGGGFHHCSANRAQGFCLFADIMLTIRYLWREISDQINILIVDLDAHQGNGYASDVLNLSREQQKQIYILDAFNPNIYPGDEIAMTAINRAVHLRSKIEDKDYLPLIEFHLNATLNTDKFKPHLIIYNAGTDILVGDRLGRLSISPEGIKKRDEIVFKFAKENSFSILMLLSGGYQLNNAEVIADSIRNLFDKTLIKPIN